MKYGLVDLSSENAQLEIIISTERYAVEYSLKWVGVVYFLAAICGS